MKTRSNRVGAQRRVQMRSALLVYLAAFVLLRAAAFLVLPRIPGALMANSLLQPVIHALVAVVCIGMPAAAGLFLVDGEHGELLPMQQLGAGAVLPLALTGALALCPISLLQNMELAVLGRFFAIWPQTGAPLPPLLFLPNALVSALLVPVLEEFFFRGYLMGVFAQQGRREAVLYSALLFALLHSATQSMLGYMVLGLLLGAVVLRTGSLLAAILVHSMYNLTALVMSGAGLAGLFGGLTFFSAALRLFGTLAMVSCLRRLWRAHRPHKRTAFFETLRLSGREVSRLLSALLVTLLLMGASWLVIHPEVYEPVLEKWEKQCKQYLTEQFGIQWEEEEEE